MARWQAQSGLRLDLDFVALAFSGEGELGFLNASGYPLAFVESSGELLPILQQGTQIDDHVFLPERFGYQTMSHAALTAALRTLIERSRTDDPVPITINHHPAWWHQSQGAFLGALLRAAKQLELPVIGAEHWLDHVLAVRSMLAARDPASGRLQVFAGGAQVALLMPDPDAANARVLGGLRYRIESPPAGRVSTWELAR
jgi:hypothetical protein